MPEWRKMTAPAREALAGRLRHAREQTGLTQRDVARHLNVSQRLISDIEGGQRKVDCAELMTLAEFYEVDPCWLLRGH